MSSGVRNISWLVRRNWGLQSTHHYIFKIWRPKLLSFHFSRGLFTGLLPNNFLCQFSWLFQSSSVTEGDKSNLQLCCRDWWGSSHESIMKGNRYLEQTQGFLSLSRSTHRTRTWPFLKPHNFTSSIGLHPCPFWESDGFVFATPILGSSKWHLYQKQFCFPMPWCTGSLPLPMNCQKTSAGVGWDTEEEVQDMLGSWAVA